MNETDTNFKIIRSTDIKQRLPISKSKSLQSGSRKYWQSLQPHFRQLRYSVKQP